MGGRWHGRAGEEKVFQHEACDPGRLWRRWHMMVDGWMVVAEEGKERTGKVVVLGGGCGAGAGAGPAGRVVL